MKITEKQTKTMEVDVPIAFGCDGCGGLMDLPEHETMPNNGVMVRVMGGYGCFFDGADVCVDLCKQCTEKLIELFPAIRAKMESDEISS